MQLLTVAEVAERLSVSRMTVYRMIADGRLRSLTIGRARRVPSSAVDAFVADQLQAGDAA